MASLLSANSSTDDLSRFKTTPASSSRTSLGLSEMMDDQSVATMRTNGAFDSDIDIIIIGAGIAGTALSYSLSHSGYSILLIERDLSPPDRIVGELLQPGGVAALRKLGMGECLDGIDATPVEGYCVYMKGKEVEIPYPRMEAFRVAGEKEVHVEELEMEERFREEKGWSRSGKKEGRSFHHGRFIDSLRRKVIRDAPNVTVMEGTVRNLITCDHTTKVIGVAVSEKKDGTTLSETKNLYAPLTIIADGCFSKFRSIASSSPSTTSRSPSLLHPRKTPSSPIAKIQTKSHFVGLVLKSVKLPIPNHGTVCLTPEGPVLLYQIGREAEETRMLVDVKGKLPSVGDGSLKTHIETHYLPHLPPATIAPIQTALSNDRLRVMPNSFLPPKMQGRRTGRSGVIMVGDAWNMRHPLTGGGMTVAFNDAVLLTELLRPKRVGAGAGEDDGGLEDLHDWEDVAWRLQKWYWERKKLASVVNILSIALYDLFGANDENLSVLQAGCFKYLGLGGQYVAGPVGFLSALNTKPILLFYHFFSVAFYSIYVLFTQPIGDRKTAPTVLDYPELTIRSFKVFWTACVVLLPVIWTEVQI